MVDDIQKLIAEVDTMYCREVLKNRLSKIKIHNFRKFSQESQINFTFPLTVIVGKNGSGDNDIMMIVQ